ncbi:hypothetical protein MSPP1_004214 [Malassezia sp. CBS 17886]|nr:hypothetical protein MSPP1_004214 [Malassezia sp. CBS 17886]
MSGDSVDAQQPSPHVDDDPLHSWDAARVRTLRDDPLQGAWDDDASAADAYAGPGDSGIALALPADPWVASDELQGVADGAGGRGGGARGKDGGARTRTDAEASAPLLTPPGAARASDAAGAVHDPLSHASLPASPSTPPTGPPIPWTSFHRRPRGFRPLNRLRSPWPSGVDALSALASRRPHAHDATSQVSDALTAPRDMSVSLLSETEGSANGSVVVRCAEHTQPAPVVRPLLELHLLRKVTAACADVLEAEADGGESGAQQRPAGSRHAFDVSATQSEDEFQPPTASATRLAVAAGIIAVGTSAGSTLVFDLSQRLRCVCRTPDAYGAHHAVTSLSLSHDASFLGVGHASGHIILYDLLDASTPARHVHPATLDTIAQGKSEGHLVGSAVVHLSFVGRRKTALVSADADGLCFYHSLGRMLGISSNDTLRVYGKYPARAARGDSVIGDMATLPVGACEHLADTHQFTALLLPRKLLLVGLRPNARTWFRSYAPADASATCAMAWFPATLTADGAERVLHHPALAFSFGGALRVLHVRAVRVRRASPGARAATPPAAIALEEETLAEAPEQIVRMQWVHRQLLLVVTTASVLLYDVRTRSFTEQQPHDPALAAADARVWAATLHVWHSKAFVLADACVHVGDFLPWDTRVRQLEAADDPVGALRHALALYAGDGLGSAIGLPDGAAAQRGAVADRLWGLARGACERVVRRRAPPRALAELARLCAQAAVATQRFQFLFAELLEAYVAHGHERVFVVEMEAFIVGGHFLRPPPEVMQHLLAYRERTQEYARMQHLICHVDPLHLDLNQVLSLCAAHRLWDALAYVYQTALHDAVSPVVALLARICDAYALFPLLTATLCGEAWPPDAPPSGARRLLPDGAASSAAQLVFAARRVSVPGGAAPVPVSACVPDAAPHPYVAMLLRFDAEAFVDALDLVLEDGAFADGGDARGADGDERRPAPPPLFTRQHIVDCVLAATAHVPPHDAVFAAMFVARNAPKYPQFVRVRPEDVARLFTLLTEPHASPCADREFALECLFSACPFTYTAPRIHALERAQFWRVYVAALARTGQYTAMLAYYLGERGAAQAPGQLYDNVAALVRTAADAPPPAAARTSADSRPPPDPLPVADALVAHAPQISEALLGDAARVAARFCPAACSRVLDALADEPQREFVFLRALFAGHAAHASAALRRRWIALLTVFAPTRVTAHLDAHDTAFFDLAHVARVAQENRVYDAVLWAHDRRGCMEEAMAALDAVVADTGAALLACMAHGMDRAHGTAGARAVEHGRSLLQPLQAAFRMAVRLAVEHSAPAARVQDAREPWYRVLYALLTLLHVLTPGPEIADAPAPLRAQAVDTTRGIAHDTLTALVTSVPSETVSFADLFQVRTIVSDMLAAYRLRCDVLALGVRLNEADVARLFHALARARSAGQLVRGGKGEDGGSAAPAPVGVRGDAQAGVR